MDVHICNGFEWCSQGFSSVEDSKGTFLGCFSYDISGPPIQQFEVKVCKLVIIVLFV